MGANQKVPLAVQADVLFDLHQVLRGLIRDRGYCAVVVVTLALTVGATTAVFAVVDGIARARPLQQVVDSALASRRYQVTVFVVFAAVGFLIAMIGVYAMTAYGISRRRREMNIRVALGASAPGVVALVMRQSAVPIVAGVGLGRRCRWQPAPPSRRCFSR
jgi:ABC-type antimicrobial peptide transport system permease subunit